MLKYNPQPSLFIQASITQPECSVVWILLEVLLLQFISKIPIISLIISVDRVGKLRKRLQILKII